MINKLIQFFTFAKIARVLEAATPIQTTVMDELFPELIREQLDSPLVPVSLLKETIGVAPVVTRGGDAYPVSGDELTIDYMQPLPIRLVNKVDAQEFNNLKLLDMAKLEGWAQRKILQLRKTTRLTLEALAAQAAFNAEIDFPLLNNGAYVSYKVSFGGEMAEQAVAAEKKWDHADATMRLVYLLLEDMAAALDDAGYGGDKVTYVGRDAWAELLGLLDAADTKKSKITAKFADDGSINLRGHVLKKMGETWKNPKDGATVHKLPPKEIRMISKGHTCLFYTAVDDLDANLAPLPLFVKPHQVRTPSRLEIHSESKPLPGIAPGAVIKAAVLA